MHSKTTDRITNQNHNDLPDACPVGHMVAEVRLNDPIKLYDSLLVMTLFM